MNVLQAMIDTALKKFLVCKTLSIGDHAVEQPSLRRIFQSWKKQGRQGRLSTSENYAIIAKVNKLIDQGLHLPFIKVNTRRRVAAEPTFLQAIAGQL